MPAGFDAGFACGIVFTLAMLAAGYGCYWLVQASRRAAYAEVDNTADAATLAAEHYYDTHSYDNRDPLSPPSSPQAAGDEPDSPVIHDLRRGIHGRPR